jgi:hypothetical protein
MSNALATGDRSGAYFNYRLAPGKSIDDYPAEEQAQIIQDYYEITARYGNTAPPPLWVQQRQSDLALYEALIRQVRQAIPLSDIVLYERSVMTMPGGGVTLPNSWEESRSGLVPLLEYRFDLF